MRFLQKLLLSLRIFASRMYKMTEHKITPLAELLPILVEQRRHGRRIVFTNGCFDLMHPGHVGYLEAARQRGDLLVVGLNTDASVQRLKGPFRPIVEQGARARVMAALAAVDFVVFFAEDTPQQLIEQVQPDVLVKGADYALDDIVGADFVLTHGGRVERIPLVEGYSTTALVEKIQGGSIDH